MSICASHAGLPYKDVESSLRLFLEEVLPEVRTWGEESYEPVRARVNAGS